MFLPQCIIVDDNDTIHERDFKWGKECISFTIKFIYFYVLIVYGNVCA